MSIKNNDTTVNKVFLVVNNIKTKSIRKIKNLISFKLKPPKPNTIENNLEEWSNWDWSKHGEEWSNTPEWKNNLIEHVLKPNVPINSNILEIGPGAGRWTEHLVERAARLILIDLVPKCIEICKERFKAFLVPPTSGVSANSDSLICKKA